MKTKPANKFVRVLQRSLVVLILSTAVRSRFAVADELHITSIISGTNGVAVEWTNSTPGGAFTVQVEQFYIRRHLDQRKVPISLAHSRDTLGGNDPAGSPGALLPRQE